MKDNYVGNDINFSLDTFDIDSSDSENTILILNLSNDTTSSISSCTNSISAIPCDQSYDIDHVHSFFYDSNYIESVKQQNVPFSPDSLVLNEKDISNFLADLFDFD